MAARGTLRVLAIQEALMVLTSAGALTTLKGPGVLRGVERLARTLCPWKVADDLEDPESPRQS